MYRDLAHCFLELQPNPPPPLNLCLGNKYVTTIFQAFVMNLAYMLSLNAACVIAFYALPSLDCNTATKWGLLLSIYVSRYLLTTMHSFWDNAHALCKAILLLALATWQQRKLVQCVKA